MEEHPVVAEPVQPAALEGVDADPFEVEIGVGTQHALQTRHDAFGFLSSSGSASQPNCRSMRQICRPVCAARPMPGIEGGSNQNQRSVGKSAFIFTSRDQEAVLEDLPPECQPHVPADGAARAVRCEKVVRLKPVGPVRCIH